MLPYPSCRTQKDPWLPYVAPYRQPNDSVGEGRRGAQIPLRLSVFESWTALFTAGLASLILRAPYPSVP